MNDDECKGGMKFFKQACGLLKIGTGAIDQQTNLAIARQINHDLWDAITGGDKIRGMDVASLDRHFQAAMQASQKALTPAAVHRLHQVIPNLTIDSGTMAAHPADLGPTAKVGAVLKSNTPVQIGHRMDVPSGVGNVPTKGFDASIASTMKGRPELLAMNGNGPNGLLDMIGKMPNPLGMLKVLCEFLGALFTNALEGMESILGELHLNPAELYKDAFAASSEALKRKFVT